MTLLTAMLLYAETQLVHVNMSQLLDHLAVMEMLALLMILVLLEFVLELILTVVFLLMSVSIEPVLLVLALMFHTPMDFLATTITTAVLLEITV